MQDAPERIWAWVWDLGGYGQPHGRREWVDFRPKQFHVSRFMPTGTKWWQVFAGKEVNIEQAVTQYTRTDLCITEAECQRRIDAAVQADRDVLVDLADDIIRASNTLMLMLAGELTMTKPSIETALRRTVDARNTWDTAIRARGQE